jgi:hypothetical protein
MRLTFLDSGGTGWACSRKFLRGKEAEHWYDRYWHFGTRYLSSGYGFLLVTKYDSSVRDQLRLHMRHHYFKMFLIAQMQKASLLVAWERLSRLLQDYASEEAGRSSRRRFHQAHRWLAEDLASYIAVFEFSEVTNQIQGRELFNLMRRHLGSPELYGELLKQLEFARMVEQGNYTETLAESQVSLQGMANLWIPVSLAFSFLGLSIGIAKLDGWIDNPHSLSISLNAISTGWPRVAVFGIIVVVVWGAFFLLFKLLNRWHVRRSK